MYKRYAKWLYDPDDELAPKFWRKIKPKKIDWEKKLKDKWLTKKQFYKLLDVVDYARDKALFSVAVEGALRSGELLGLRIKDVQQTSYGYDITVSGKTGTSTFLVVLFAPLLTQWLNLHPLKHDKDAPLWVSNNASKGWVAMSKRALHWTVRKYGERAGLSKDFSSHWLRHTKITWTAKNNEVHISDEMAKKMFRWSNSSRMFSRYTHLHGVDSKEAFLNLAGVKQEEEVIEDKSLDLQKCLNCGESNSATMVYCGKCGFILSEEEARKVIEADREEKDQKKRMEAFIQLILAKEHLDKEWKKLMKD